VTVVRSSSKGGQHVLILLLDGEHTFGFCRLSGDAESKHECILAAQTSGKRVSPVTSSSWVATRISSSTCSRVRRAASPSSRSASTSPRTAERLRLMSSSSKRSASSAVRESASTSPRTAESARCAASLSPRRDADSDNAASLSPRRNADSETAASLSPEVRLRDDDSSDTWGLGYDVKTAQDFPSWREVGKWESSQVMWNGSKSVTKHQ
jgi:hypothetical protein